MLNPSRLRAVIAHHRHSADLQSAPSESVPAPPPTRPSFTHTHKHSSQNSQVTFHLPSKTENSSCQEVPRITFLQLNHVTSPLTVTALTRTLSGTEKCLWLWPIITLNDLSSGHFGTFTFSLRLYGIEVPAKWTLKKEKKKFCLASKSCTCTQIGPTAISTLAKQWII